MIRDTYEKWMADKAAARSRSHGEDFFEQERRYVDPFRIYGNVYYVGDSWVCVHLVDTGDGLLLIDAGNCGAIHLLIHAIWKLGFDPADVKWLILSHAHVDHFGAAAFLKNMFGTKIYLGARDAQMLREEPELTFIQGCPDLSAELFTPDVLIHEGDVHTFGNTAITFREAPGHTAGCIACFFDGAENGAVKRFGYFGGFGFNTIVKDMLLECGDTTYYRRQEFMDSLKKVEDEPVDIFLGNHTRNNDLLQKRELMLSGVPYNPFVDPAEWKAYMQATQRKLRGFMDDPKNN